MPLSEDSFPSSFSFAAKLGNMSDQEIGMSGFWAKYANLCIRKKICPLRCILKHLKGAVLICPVEYIRAAHCSCVNTALASDNSLAIVHFFSDLYLKDKAFYEDFHHETAQTKRTFPIPVSLSHGNLMSMCHSLGSCLKTNQQLTILKLENLPLSFDQVKLLAEGIPETTSLQVLSLAGCPVGDEAIKMLVQSLCRTFSVQWVNFSSCKIMVKGIAAIADALEFQSVIRRTEIWQHSLRYRKPDLEDFKGLDRISLNDNSDINDESIKILLEPLTNDLWLKALDLQKCSITTEGATYLLHVLEKNCIMQVLDLRLNDAIGESVVEQITDQLNANNAGKTLKYEPLSLISKPSLKRKKTFEKRVLKPAISVKIRATPRRPCFRGLKSRKKDNSLRLPQMQSTAQQTEEEFSGALGNVQDIHEQFVDDTTALVKSLAKEMEELKMALHEERETKISVWRKLQETEAENRSLKEQLQNRKAPEGYVLVDSETCVQIQETFQKFSNFLALLNEAGLKNFVTSPVREHTFHLQASNSDFGAYQSVHYLPQTGAFASQNKIAIMNEDPSFRPARLVEDIHLEHQKIPAACSEITQSHHEQHKPIPAKFLCLQDKVHLVKFGDSLHSSVENCLSLDKQQIFYPENLQDKVVPVLKLQDSAVQDTKVDVQMNIHNKKNSQPVLGSSSSSSCSSRVNSACNSLHKLSIKTDGSLSNVSTDSEVSLRRCMSECRCEKHFRSGMKSSHSHTEVENRLLNNVYNEILANNSKKYPCPPVTSIPCIIIQKSHSETEITQASEDKSGSMFGHCDMDHRTHSKHAQSKVAPPATRHSSKSDSSSDAGPLSNKRAENSVTSAASSKNSSKSATKVKSASNQKGNSSSSDSIHTEIAGSPSTSSNSDTRSKGKSKKS